MLNRFKKRFENLKQKLLVSVSGGLDSMVLCDLLLKLNLDFSIAHVNYKLRGKESDFDENFVKNYANQKKINFYSISHDLSTYNKSIQAKAREIRYNYLHKLKDDNKFDYILTGHHFDDNIETVFLNLRRGKKNNSFLGIREKNNCFLRPLINFTKDDIFIFLDNSLCNKIKISSINNIKIAWVRNWERKWLPHLKNFDYVLCCNKKAKNFFNNNGIKSYILPIGANFENFNFQRKKTNDIFIDCNLFNRRKIVDIILELKKKTNYKIKICGKNWKKYLSNKEFNLIKKDYSNFILYNDASFIKRFNLLQFQYLLLFSKPSVAIAITQSSNAFESLSFFSIKYDIELPIASYNAVCPLGFKLLIFKERT